MTRNQVGEDIPTSAGAPQAVAPLSLGGEFPDPLPSLSPEWQPYVDRVAARLSDSEPVVLPTPRAVTRTGRILIVDDEPSVCEMLSTALQEAGFICESVHSGTEALQRLDQQPYDVAIVDLMVPGVGGLQVMREIRQRKELIRVIIITGYGDLDTAVEALRARADDYILKPIQIDEFVNAVKRALGRQEVLRSIRLSHRQMAQQLSSLNIQLQRRFAGGVVALATALEARDRFTKGHSSRVATTCIEVGRAMGFHGAELDDLAVGALLHDVGKIAVPDGILLKEGQLTEAEFQKIRGHPRMGYDILYPFFGRGIITECALYHHERCDGTGYPTGLKGDQLPLAGRIISLCDAFDAMNSVRPYRDALSERSALREIEKNRGTQFDPEIADLFCSIRPYEILKGESTPAGRSGEELRAQQSGVQL